MFKEVGIDITSRKLYAYVLIGFKNDTFEKAEKRLMDTLKAGFIPFAMLYKNEEGYENKGWKVFQRKWARAIIVISSFPEFFPKKPKRGVRARKQYKPTMIQQFGKGGK